jgi:hypothetical protein
MIGKIARGDAGDTGEHDVHELRRRHTGNPTPPSVPYVQRMEDLPYEDELPDFYGPEDEIEAELSELVDAGELCMGWDSERQEAIYWLPEPTPVAEPSGPVTHRRPRHAHKTHRHSKLYRRVVLTVAASVAPFFIGMMAEAAVDMHTERTHPVDQPDIAVDTAHAGTVTPAATTATAKNAGSTSHYGNYKPAGSSYTPAKVTVSPTAENPGSYVGTHRKVIGAAAPKAAKKPESPAPTASASASPSPAAPRPRHHRHRPHTAAEAVVGDLMGQVSSLLG